MLLKSLELHGFKTFPEKTKLSFGNGITAVVGPNGSGKSNISDAIRWVLGEQSVKTLRCSKMEDVIFGGTPTRKAQGFSEVTLTIDNTDRRLPFDNDDVAVSRRYYRSGESEYLINKAVVRLKDIHELFMDTGLGRDGYSVIGQGKIDSIVSSKSEDRREIFEEAAGISRFKYRKFEAQRKLKQAEENLLRLKDILSELEERVGPLKEQSSKAKEYIKLMDEKRSLEIGIWLDTLDKSSKILKDHEAKISIASNQYENIESSIERIKTETEEIFMKSNSISASIEETRKQISIFDETASQKLSKKSVLENDVLHNNESIKRLQNEIFDIKDSYADIDLKIDEKKLKIAEINNEVLEKQRLLEDANNQYESLKNNIEDFSSALNNLSKELSDLNLKASDQKVNALALDSGISELKLRLSDISSALENYDTRLSNLKSMFSDYNEMKLDAEKRSLEIENSVKGYEFKLQNKKQKTNHMKEEADKLSLEAEGKIRKMRILEELERNLEGFAQSVKSVMRESRNGVLSGIHGPVSRIIKVDAKYAVAIETALGAAMQNIVVQTEKDAKSAIALLKRKNLGRATFLPLSTIKGRKIDKSELVNIDGFLGIASELCSCDPVYNEIINSMLGRIIISEDLNKAAIIAKKFSYKFRVVTLDGQVINAGGSFTGGSLSKNSGILSRVAEMERLKSESEELKLRANRAYTLYTQSEEEVSKLEAELLGSRGDLSKAKEEYIRISAECKNVSSEINHLKALIEKNTVESNAISDKIQNSIREREYSQDTYNGYLSKIKETEEKIALISGDKDIVSQTREEIINKIQELKILILTCQKNAESIDYEIRSMNDSKIDQFGKIERLENQIEEFKQKNISINDEILLVDNEFKDLKIKSKTAEENIRNFNIQKMDIEKYTVELRQNERDKTIERENISKELARLEEQKSGIQKEYDLIIAKLWEEYELTRREAEQNTEKIEDIQGAKRILNDIRSKIKKLGSVNVSAIEEYKEVSSRYEFLGSQLDDVEKSKNELTKLTIDLTKQMRDLFTERFNLINSNFMSTFKELFGGGKAELRLTDPSDVLNSGIEICVQPPGKIVTHLESLSGGEKALVAIALYFAIMKVSPAPFCVLDEIEAALDDVNVYRYAAYLRKMNKNTQFIVITHRRGTMEEADVLYGVTMQDEGISKLLELRASEIESKLGIKQ